MRTNLYPKRLVYANCVIFLFAIAMNLTSCSNDLKDTYSIEQNNFTKLDAFSKKLIENPVYFEFLNNKIDFLLEYKFILDSKSAESASRIKNHFQSIQFTSKKQRIAEIVAIPELSKEESANLIRLSTNLYESSIQLKQLFNSNDFYSENDINKVFENISQSQQNLDLLYSNKSKFDESSTSRSRLTTRQCNLRFKLCIGGSSAFAIIAGAGCLYTIVFGPEAVLGCLSGDTILSNVFFTNCYNKWLRCRRG